MLEDLAWVTLEDRVMKLHVLLFLHLKDDLSGAVLGIEVILALLQLYFYLELVALDVINSIEEDLLLRVGFGVGHR